MYMFSDTVMTICFMLWGRGISGPGGHSQINILLMYMWPLFFFLISNVLLLIFEDSFTLKSEFLVSHQTPPHLSFSSPIANHIMKTAKIRAAFETERGLDTLPRA